MKRPSEPVAGGTATPLRLHLPPEVDSSHLAALLTPLVERGQVWICLDASRVSRLGTVEFRALSVFAEACRRRGGFLKLQNVGERLAASVREFGVADLTGAAPR